MRIIIAGGPQCGKTTKAESLSKSYGIRNVRHTDDLMHKDWSLVSGEISYWFDEPGPWIIEGVAAIRALRKWLKRAALKSNNNSTVCDKFYWMDIPYHTLKPGQSSMLTGCQTIHTEIEQNLMNFVNKEPLLYTSKEI